MDLYLSNLSNGYRAQPVPLFWGATKSQQMVTAARKLKDTCFLEEKL